MAASPRIQSDRRGEDGLFKFKLSGRTAKKEDVNDFERNELGYLG